MCETIVSRLTAELPSAIATIVVSGPQALFAVQKFVRLANDPPQVNRIYYGQWHLQDVAASEQVVICRTQEQNVEIHCHGGNAMCRRILDDLVQAGCQLVAARDWYLSPRAPDATESQITQQAGQDLMRATTDQVAAILLDQYNGALESSIGEVLGWIAAGETDSAQQGLRKLLKWRELGLHLSEAWRIVFAGPPNVGKSSLINAIAGSNRSIVHHEPGTTRDWVEVQTAVHGWPICLSDTAGIRTSANPIEVAGIERSKQQVQSADLIVAVVDATLGWTETHSQLLSLRQNENVPILVAWNKSDLNPGMPEHELPASLREHVRPTHAVDATGVAPLMQAFSSVLLPKPPVAGEAIPFRRSHFQSLAAADTDLEQQRFQSASAKLQGLLTPVG